MRNGRCESYSVIQIISVTSGINLKTNQVKRIFTLLGFLFIVFTTSAQQAIEGQLKDYDLGKAQIINGMAGLIELGTINEDGTFVIPLNDGYKAQLTSAIEKKNAGRSNWKSSLPSVERSYGNCSTETVEITGNKEQTMISMSFGGMFSVANVEAEKMHGYLMFASDQEFADAFIAFGKFKVKEGYQLDWLYFDEAASVKGSCSLDSYAMNGEDTYTFSSEYDLEFKPGWNLVKYEILKVFTDSDGNEYIEQERSTVIEEMPADVQVCFMK